MRTTKYPSLRLHPAAFPLAIHDNNPVDGSHAMASRNLSKLRLIVAPG